jgi:hypothetical protein
LNDASFTFKNGFTIFGQSESTFDWENHEWTFPLVGGVSQVFTFMNQKMSLSLGGIYYPVTPSGGPKAGGRVTFTILFPE